MDLGQILIKFLYAAEEEVKEEAWIIVGVTFLLIGP
jgi:hypothetical protein